MRRHIKIVLIVLAAAVVVFVVLVIVTSKRVGEEAANKAVRFDAGTPEAEIIREAGAPTGREDASEYCRERGGTYELVYATPFHALWGILRLKPDHMILVCMGPDKTQRGGGFTVVDIN